MVDQLDAHTVAAIAWQVLRGLSGIAKRLAIYLAAHSADFIPITGHTERFTVQLTEELYEEFGITAARERDRRASITRAAARIAEQDPRYTRLVVDRTSTAMSCEQIGRLAGMFSCSPRALSRAGTYQPPVQSLGHASLFAMCASGRLVGRRRWAQRLSGCGVATGAVCVERGPSRVTAWEFSAEPASQMRTARTSCSGNPFWDTR